MNDFQKFKKIRSSRREIYNAIITLSDAFEEQIKLKDEINKYKKSTEPKNPNIKRRKK